MDISKMDFKGYNQSKFKAFLVSIFFFVFIFACSDIMQKDENIQSGNTVDSNTHSAGTMIAGKLPSSLHDSNSNGYVKDQIIVKFAKGTDPKVISAIQKKLHLETLRTFNSPDLFLMKITDQTSVKKIQQSLSKYQEVKYSEPNYRMS
ncbi:MAG: hypothetical protein HKO91_04570, partial [Desulfobacterales bacterium]|nr:hypothetical protein [Desulfobacterales bacterium]